MGIVAVNCFTAGYLRFKILVLDIQNVLFALHLFKPVSKSAQLRFSFVSLRATNEEIDH